MLEFRILGPVEVVRDGRPVPLGGAKQRALVADLTLHANEVVSADRLIDDLWGEEQPGTASHMLHVYVSRLRKTLEDHGRDVLVTRPPGYELRLKPPDELDATRFEVRVRQGAEVLGTRPAEALEAFDEALAWWRGRALEEFLDEPFAQPSAARLEELRQATHEDRVEALLALGRHDEALVELEGLIARFPLRERLRELQMLALYRSGRQADALQAFQAARHTLAEELGVDPGTALASLEQAILRHDPELDAPVRESRPSAPERGAEPPPRPARRRLVWAAIATTTVVGVVALIALRTVSPSGTTPNTPSASTSRGTGAETRITWTEISDPGGLRLGGAGDQVILGGAVTPDGLLAVGFTAARRPSPSEERDYDAALWIEAEPDGWRPVNDVAFAAPGNQEATDAVTIDGRIVVVGSDASPGDHDAAVWIRDIGSSSWSRVARDAPGMRKAGDQWIRGVTWTGSHLVAVGVNRRSGGDADAAIWTSRDALTWAVLVPTNLGVPGDQQMIGVTAFEGLVVATGFSVTTENQDAAVWISRDDGSTWETVDAEALGGEGDQQINTVVPAGPGLVAVGRETIAGDVNAAVWLSTDGTAWQRVEDPRGELAGLGVQEMSAITTARGLIVAAGREVVGRETNAAVWTSLDGTTWTRLPVDSPEGSTFNDFGGQAIRALLVVDDVFVALGREGRGGDDDGDIWLGRPAG